MCVLTLFSSSVLTSFKTLLVLGLAILTPTENDEESIFKFCSWQLNQSIKIAGNVCAFTFMSNALICILDRVSHKLGEEGVVNKAKPAIG